MGHPPLPAVGEVFVYSACTWGTPRVLGEGCRSCAFGSFGFAGQVAHDVDVGPQRQAVP